MAERAKALEAASSEGAELGQMRAKLQEALTECEQERNDLKTETGHLKTQVQEAKDTLTKNEKAHKSELQAVQSALEEQKTSNAEAQARADAAESSLKDLSGGAEALGLVSLFLPHVMT